MKTDLKGLNFGRFYIFAPENASSGEVNVDEWQEIWQFDDFIYVLLMI
jgi:hypothetical protein